MLGWLRPYVESFDLNRYPHEFPKSTNPLFTDEDLNPENQYSGQSKFIQNHGHIKNYLTQGKGYTTFYDISVYIILVVFLGVVVRELCIMFVDENNKSYMAICLLIIVCSAVMY